MEVEVPVAGGGGGPVDGERLTYELPETVPAPVTDEAVGAAVLGEIQRPPAEDGRLLGRLDGYEVAPAPSEDLSGSEVDHSEAILSPVPVESNVLGSSVAEAPHPAPGDLVTVEIEGRVFPDQVIQSTGWTNGEGLADRLPFTEARLEATSSGIGGTGGTNESASGTLVVAFPDPIGLDGLTIVSAELIAEAYTDEDGTFLQDGSVSITWRYGIADEASPNRVYFSQNRLTTGLQRLDLSGVLTSWDAVRGLRVRAFGTVNSGTGLTPVTTSARSPYVRLDLLARKDYP